MLTRSAGLAAGLTGLFLAAPGFAAEVANPADDTVVIATEISAADRPVIDGDLGDAAWTRAVVVDTFYQVEPVAYATPSERTELRILYDRERLYIAVYNFDREPSRIKAAVKSRDGSLPRDDFIRIMIDPQGSRRDAYGFEMNPLGARTDGLVQNSNNFLINWNALWEGRTQIAADGWVAEIAIPFRTLSFDPARDRWGFDLVRQIKRKTETIRLAPTPAGAQFNDLTHEGALVGLQELSQGKGLDIQLYGRVRYNSEWPGDQRSTKLEPSATVYYKITPPLTGTLTYNPDFSDSPLDTRRVNTTRFTPFDPETRDFFLQDAASFEFGGRGFSIRNNGQPFFSRNIGLVNGEPVGMQWGGKLSGEAGRLRLGALTARTKASGTLRAQTLSVARLSTPVLAESRVGMILTNGDPTGTSHNTVGGVDFQYRNSNVNDGRQLLTDLYFEHSVSDVRPDADAFGIAVVYPNEPWFIDAYAKQTGTHFQPALGFVNRTGVREYVGKQTRRTRINGNFLRWYEFGTVNDIATDLDNRLLDWRNVLQTTLQNNAGDALQVNLIHQLQRLDKAFTLPGGITAPSGRYHWRNVGVQLDSSFARPVSVSWRVECCRFYDGNYFSNDLEIGYRPNGTLDLSVHHVYNHIALPQGGVEIHIQTADVGIQFTPDMQLRTQLQYDNISERFRLLVRYKWEPIPGTEIFAAFGQDAQTSNPLYRSQYLSRRNEVLLRIGHLLQY